MSTAIEKDMVLEGPLWPEPVRVLSVDHFGTMLQVDAVGTRPRQFYPGIIVTAAQADALKVVSSAKGMDFSGDPEAFHLAIEALRIRLAYEYDPHFAVNASTITPLPHLAPEFTCQPKTAAPRIHLPTKTAAPSDAGWSRPLVKPLPHRANLNHSHPPRRPSRRTREGRSDAVVELHAQ